MGNFKRIKYRDDLDGVSVVKEYGSYTEENVIFFYDNLRHHTSPVLGLKRLKVYWFRRYTCSPILGELSEGGVKVMKVGKVEEVEKVEGLLVLGAIPAQPVRRDRSPILEELSEGLR